MTPNDNGIFVTKDDKKKMISQLSDEVMGHAHVLSTVVSLSTCRHWILHIGKVFSQDAV